MIHKTTPISTLANESMSEVFHTQELLEYDGGKNIGVLSGFLGDLKDTETRIRWYGREVLEGPNYEILNEADGSNAESIFLATASGKCVEINIQRLMRHKYLLFEWRTDSAADSHTSIRIVKFITAHI